MNKILLILLIGILLFSGSDAFSQYGSLSVRAGKCKIEDDLNDAGFAGLAYSYHLNSALALVGGFTYSGSSLITQFPHEQEGSDYNFEAQFSNHGYTFYVGPELNKQINDSRFYFYLRPEIGINLINSNSELYKVGTIDEGELEENDVFISNEYALDKRAKSSGVTDLYLAVEGGIRFTLGKIYTFSIFAGINNTDYSKAVNNIVETQSKWNMFPVPTEKQMSLGIEMSMPIHGFMQK